MLRNHYNSKDSRSEGQDNQITWEMDKLLASHPDSKKGQKIILIGIEICKYG